MPILLGAAHSFGSQDFPSGIGFTGIAIALLGRNNPVGIAFASVLWGFLDVSNQILDIESIPKEIVTIMQGAVVLAVVVAYEIVRRIGVATEQRRVMSTEDAAPPAAGARGHGRGPMSLTNERDAVEAPAVHAPGRAPVRRSGAAHRGATRSSGCSSSCPSPRQLSGANDITSSGTAGAALRLAVPDPARRPRRACGPSGRASSTSASRA